jgi:poly(A) polymerase
MPRPRNEREFAVEVVRSLREAGHEALFAGGCVRDEILGLEPKDYDVATSARPEEVEARFPRTISVGAAFGVIEVLGPRPYRIQVATFRADGEYSDGRRPDRVVYCSAEEDAKRRDFTINGMFLDPIEGRVIDHVGGRADLDAHLIRAIGDPVERFTEDRLRMLRAVRLTARFEFSLDAATADAIGSIAPLLSEGVSAERVADELRKMLVDRHRARAMQLFMDLGLAAVVMPELLPMRGLPQGLPRPDGPGLPPPGQPGLAPPAMSETAPGDLWQHVLRVLHLLPEESSFPLAMAALLHYTFHGHEHVGKRMATDICLRLKLSNEERERIEWLVEKHQVLADTQYMRPAKLKVLLIHKGVEELFALHRADAFASNRAIDHVDLAERKRREWLQDGTLNPAMILTGNELMEMGLTPGPLFKRLLEAVRESQLDGTIRNVEEAREMVRKMVEQGEK